MFQIVTFVVIWTFIENIVIINNCFCTLYLRVNVSLKHTGEAANLLFLNVQCAFVGGWSVLLLLLFSTLES